MEATLVSIAVYDGSRLDPSYTISNIPVPPDMALHADNRGATAAVVRRMGEDEARRLAKRCTECRKHKVERFVTDVRLGWPEPEAIAVGVVAVCSSAGCAESAAEFLRAVLAGGGGHPPPKNGKQPLDIELLICASWPEGSSDCTFEERAVRRRVEVPAEIIHDSLVEFAKTKEVTEELARRECETLLKARRPRCLACAAHAIGFVSLGTLYPNTWPRTFRSNLYPACGSCDAALARRAQLWQEKADKATGLRPHRILTCGAQCGASSVDPATFQRCSRCKLVSYCSKECQRKDWARHKKVCAPPGGD
ncbi:hypothetical protein DFJ74DRAFT_748020 [Hyaloraphidium curvatum]|nr:hypothetical protein DFJ74DRAFT_748020 [Hyaloraphidium curvatum]